MINPETLRLIINDGERLVPGQSHGLDEVVRHKSSYQFFKAIVEADLKARDSVPSKPVIILDLGCGVGHGSLTMSTIPGVRVVGADPSADSIDYARQNYGAPNIDYRVASAEETAAKREPYDYVVSRHAVEHIEDGIELVRNLDFSSRLLVNVPFREPLGNPHHKLNFIEEANFSRYENAEFFYEGLNGVTVLRAEELEMANSIICVASRPGMTPVHDVVTFPMTAWAPTPVERVVMEAPFVKEALERSNTELEQLRHKFAIEQAEVMRLRQQNEMLLGQSTALSETTQALRLQAASLGQTVESQKSEFELYRETLTQRTAEVSGLASELTAAYDRIKVMTSERDALNASLPMRVMRRVWSKARLS